jgi:hypothetical protein
MACRVKILWWSISGAAKKKQNKAGSRENQETLEMMFTGTLIEDLIATVERVELRAQAEALEMAEVEAWFASDQENASAKLLGVA